MISRSNIKKKKENELKEEGITIISLVVTIIILLILAGVTIGTVSGDNGLFRRAKEAVEESKKAEYQENLATIGLGIKLENASSKVSSKEYIDLFEEEMNRQIAGNTIFKESTIRRKNDETLRIETKEGYIYYVRENEAIYIGKAGEVDESEIPDITLGDINFKYSTEEWTNEDVTIEITVGENVGNKENYIIEYSKDAKNWARYTKEITMTENGEIYARAKDKFGDIKVEKYATGEVQNIDKNAPTPGTITMIEEVIDGPIYLGGAETPRNLFIEMENGTDNENESGHKLTNYSISGPTTLESSSESMLLTKEGTYTITVVTEDLAGNVSIPRTYTINISKFDENGCAKDNVKIYEEGGNYWVPEGFKIAEDSGVKVNEGIVVEDKNENQWVWIPCYVEGGVGSNVENAVKYDRYAFTRDDWKYRQTKLTKKDEKGNTVPDLDADGSQKIGWAANNYYFHEAINADDQASISRFGGYYIGRYEAGDKESTLVKEMRTEVKYSNNEQGDVTHTVTIKKGQAPYNYVTQAQCATLSNGFANANNYNTSKMYTKLCSSYAWDVALKFIEKEYLEYGNNSKDKDGNTIGNYSDVTVIYTDLEGKGQVVQAEGDSGVEHTVIPTGQTIAVKNIYDMGGNVYEYTSESYSRESHPFVLRGGICIGSAGDYPAGLRNNYDGSAYEYGSFRPTLYLSNAIS